MKKFILKVLLFFAIVVAMDFAFGCLFSWLRTHAKGGSTANCEYIANRATEDVIILGSSHATHHYIPQIIEDTLGVSCYNCGEEGNGVVLAYGRLKMLTNRYHPKLVLYEITPGYDYGAAEPDTKYLGYLRAYYDKEGVSEIFDDFDGELSRQKMKSKMYQNTGRLLPDVADNLIFRENRKGYAPLYGKMEVAKKSPSNEKNEVFVDELKLSYLEKLIDLCKSNDIPLVCMISPRFMYGNRIDEYEPALRLCKEKGVEVFNYLNDSMIVTQQELFQDEGHLNHEGAVIFTNKIIKEVIKTH